MAIKRNNTTFASHQKQITMKKLICAVLILTTLKLSADNWVQKASVGTTYLRSPTSFSIGNFGYVCGGQDSLSNYSNALWEYDQLNDTWTQKANYGGGNIEYTSSFVIQGIGLSLIHISEPTRPY